MHTLSSWALAVGILAVFTVGYISALMAHRNDIFR